MLRLLIFFWLLIAALGVHGQYVCTPCGLDCDTLHFAESGICPHCQMALVEDESVPRSETDTTSSLLAQIKTEAIQNSQSMPTLAYLSDVFGGRLMGTQNYYEALHWSGQQLENWGMDSVYYHNFDRGYRSWELKAFDVAVIEPNYHKVKAFPAAYTRATNGAVEGEVIYLKDADKIYEYTGKLTGKIVLLGDTYYPVESQTRPFFSRFSDDELQGAADNPDPNHREIGYLGRRSINTAIEGRDQQREDRANFFRFANVEGVLALVESSDYPYGILHADGNHMFPSYIHQDSLMIPPAFVFANEDFGRIKRLLAAGLQPKLKIQLETEFGQETNYHQNLLAEIRGQDPVLQKEVIMLGAHFDSWHGASGAVDNGAGAVMMMEAMRILKELDLPMKRTIRLALWGGHEQGFLGSQAYVSDFVGDIWTGEMQPDADLITAYFNLDNGAGRIRGIYGMGNDRVLPVFETLLADCPGQNTLTLQYTDQTDHELFDRLNVPAFQFIQDPLDYISAVHHTDIDLYEYVPVSDMQENAALLAYLLYQVANLEEPLPRKAFNSPKASREGSTSFQITAYPEAKQVNVIGTFNNWNLFGTALYQTPDGWECKLELPAGAYLYKFHIDGDFVADPRTLESDLMQDGQGHGGLTKIRVD